MNISLGKAIALAVASAVLSALVTAAVLKPAPVPPADKATIKTVTEQPADTDEKAEPVSKIEIDVEQAMKDRSLGADDAPITIIEYASMTCGHCAAFHNQTLPEIKKELIDTGKARLVFRDMPWDTHALKAGKLARCAPHDQYFDLVGTIFKTQEHWVESPDPLNALKDIGVSAGMEEKYIQACLDDEPLTAGILQMQKDARSDYDIKSTPAFIFLQDGQRLESYPAFEDIVKKLGSHAH